MSDFGLTHIFTIVDECGNLWDWKDTKICYRCRGTMTLSVLNIWVHQDYDKMLTCTGRK